MSEKEILLSINEKLDNLILAISVSGKSFQEFSYLLNIFRQFIDNSRRHVVNLPYELAGMLPIELLNEIP